MRRSNRKIYECIKDYIAENEEPPTIREICKLTGLSSPATVHKHLKNMKAKGYIDYTPKKKRSLEVKE